MYPPTNTVGNGAHRIRNAEIVSVAGVNGPPPMSDQQQQQAISTADSTPQSFPKPMFQPPPPPPPPHTSWIQQQQRQSHNGYTFPTKYASGTSAIPPAMVVGDNVHKPDMGSLLGNRQHENLRHTAYPFHRQPPPPPLLPPAPMYTPTGQFPSSQAETKPLGSMVPPPIQHHSTSNLSVHKLASPLYSTPPLIPLPFTASTSSPLSQRMNAPLPIPHHDQHQQHHQHTPHVPLFTRTIQSYPDLYYNTIPIYFPRKALEMWKSKNNNSSSNLLLPPPEDSRFLVQDDGNASPRLLTCNIMVLPQTSHLLQKTMGGTTTANQEKTRILGLICQPLAIPSVDFVIHDYSSTCSLKDDEGELPPDLEAIPLVSKLNDDEVSSSTFESFPSFSRSRNPHHPVTPLRCKFCQAYINPFCTVSYNTQKETCTMTCPFCPTQTTVSLETFLSSTSSSHDVQPILPNLESTSLNSMTHTAALKYGTVEYEVGGPYITRQLDSSQHVCNKKVSTTLPPPLVHLYALDISSGMSTYAHSNSILLQGYLDTLKLVAKEIALSWSKQQQQEEQLSSVLPRVGLILYDDIGRIIIPYWRLQKIHTTDEFEWRVQVALMLDVSKDPFAPLPLSEWTYYAMDYKEQSNTRESNNNDIVQFYNSLNGWSEMLQQIPTILNQITPRKGEVNTKSNLNFSGSALAALTHALESSPMDSLGGRITILTSSRPNAGVGALTDFEISYSSEKISVGGSSTTAKYANIESERILYTSLLKLVEAKIPFTKNQTDDQAYSFYSQIIKQSQQSNISIDIYISTPRIMGRNFLGLATLGDVCQQTCGTLKWLKYNDVTDIQGSWKNQLQCELLRSALVYSGSDAVFKLRCSNGLHVKNFLPRNNLRVGNVVDTSELEFTRVNADTCISIELDYDIGGISQAGSGKTNPIAYFQTALLYTTVTGHRRLRVSTLALPTTTSESEVFKAVRFGATCTLLIRKVMDGLYDPNECGNLKRAGSIVMDHCVNILANYRHFTEARHNTWDTMALPETLGLLPLFCLGLRKSLMFRSSLTKDATQSSFPSPTGDERAYRLCYGSRITPYMSMLYVYPNLFSILDMKTGEGEWSPSPPKLTESRKKILSHILMTEPIPSSVSELKENGIYILDDGLTIYLFIGRDVSIETRAGFLSYDDGEPRLQSSSELAKNILRIIYQIRRFTSMGATQEQCIRPMFSPLVLVIGTGGSGFRKGIDDASEKSMIDSCVDDTSGGESSYQDFLYEVHRRVKEKQKLLT